MADEKSEDDAQHEERKPPVRRSTRQHRPVKDENLLNMIAAMTDSDSEEDSDFECNEVEAESGSDEEEDDNHPPEQAGGRGAADKGGEDEDQSSDSDEEEEQEEEEEEEEEEGGGEANGLKYESVFDILKKKVQDKEPASPSSSLDSQSISTFSVSGGKAKKLEVLICGICLDDECDEEDEIIECDNCGITVHEGCYGVCDDDVSTASNDTDSPTEPWFCDICRAGVQPDCELCPNLGGIFKETDTGQWVHLACALYTPGVAFINPDKLEGVTLSEIPPARWGAKECMLCEDSRFSRTGVCTGCDAGLCKNHFHVLCAQKNGLLSEVPEDKDEPDVADPLYAHCKAHIDKSLAKERRRNWLAFESHFKKFALRHKNSDRSRIEEYLEQAQQKYREDKNIRPTPYTPTDRIPRLLSTCPSACRQLYKKAELLGFTSEQTQNVLDNLATVRRKWYIQPALSIEFVNYFHDRDSRMVKMQSRQKELESNNKQLQAQEQELMSKFEDLTKHVGILSRTVDSLRSKSTELHKVLCKLAKKDLPSPDILTPKKRKIGRDQEEHEKTISLHVCYTCKGTGNQHLQVECDTCHNFYHLGCVDPPLTRMPKKSGKCLWQCSECDNSDSNDEEVEVDPNDDTPNVANRRRRTIKQPVKFTSAPVPKEEEEKKPEKHESRANKRKLPKKDKDGAPYVERRGRKRKTEQPSEKKLKLGEGPICCASCGNSGKKMVKCDECKQSYHYECLDPPVKSNPKSKGYSWICTHCDNSDEDSDASETNRVEEKEKERRERRSKEKEPDSEPSSPQEVVKLSKILQELREKKGESVARRASAGNASTTTKPTQVETIILDDDDDDDDDDDVKPVSPKISESGQSSQTQVAVNGHS